MDRQLRIDCDEILARDLDLKSLYGQLQAIGNLYVQMDGTGSSIFKVYLPSRTGRYEAFLWCSRVLHKSYVQWAHQGANADLCRALWGPVVKNRTNTDGSELQREVGIDSIVHIARQYADHAGS